MGKLTMAVKQFATALDNRIKTMEATLGQKALEYARNDDRLHNFNAASKMTGKIPEVCLMGMKLKHTVSIQDMITDIEDGKLPSIELVEEKIGDEINYLVLLEAMIKNRIAKKEDE